MSIFAKKISKSEIDAIYKEIESVTNHMMNLADSRFGSLFKNENEGDKSFRLLSTELVVLYAKNEYWLKNRVSTRTIVGRTADLKELLAENHNYSYDLVCELFESTKILIRKYKEIYSSEDIAMACANAYFDFTILPELEDREITLEEVGHEYIVEFQILIAGAIIKANEK